MLRLRNMKRSVNVLLMMALIVHVGADEEMKK